MTTLIQITQLEIGDQVVLFGKVCEITGLTETRLFPHARLLSIRPNDEIVEALDTLVPADFQLLGLSLPRQYSIPCLLCLALVSGVLDLAKHGWPSRALCESCGGDTSGAHGPQILVTER